jgi:hypothetical protein
MAADITSNIKISLFGMDGFDHAIMGTDYGTSGLDLGTAHVPLSKVVWGDNVSANRVTTAAPLPVRLYGSNSSVPITGNVGASGTFTVQTSSTNPIIVKGSTFATDSPVSITGRIQGITNGTYLGVCGPVTISNQVAVYGVSGAQAIGVTGGRYLKSATDSVTVSGSVGINGLSMSAASHSVAVYGSDLGSKVLTKIYGSDGATLGMSGDALKVALVNSGINFSVSMGSVVGVTNGSETPLRIQGYSGSGIPVTVKGQLAGGAVEIAATSAVPVGVCGSVAIDDTDIIASLESSAKPLISNLASINSNTLAVQSIQNQLTSFNGANVTVKEINRPSNLIHGQKVVTSIPTNISTGALKVGVTIKALRANTGPVYIGSGGTLTAVNGYVLDAGDSVFIETDDLRRVFVRIDPDIKATISFIAS